MTRYQEGDVVSYKHNEGKEFTVTYVFYGSYIEYEIISKDCEKHYTQASSLKLIKRNPFNVEPSENSILKLL